MVKTVRCVVCGREFSARRSTAKYCTPNCRQIAYRERTDGFVLMYEPKTQPKHISMSDDEVAEVVIRAHGAASDLSRASLCTTAPMCVALGNAARAIESALKKEGL